MIINVLSAGLAQAGGSQAGDVAYDFKIGHFVGAPAAAQLYGQMIGSLFGAFLSFVTYRLYTSQYPIPGPIFQIPASFLDVTIARLMLNRGLPKGVEVFVVGFGSFFLVAALLKMRYADRWWQNLIPSGIAFSVGESNSSQSVASKSCQAPKAKNPLLTQSEIGMYNVPSFSMACVLGGLFY